MSVIKWFSRMFGGRNMFPPKENISSVHWSPIDPSISTLSETGIIFDNEARNVIMLVSSEQKTVTTNTPTYTSKAFIIENDEAKSEFKDFDKDCSAVDKKSDETDKGLKEAAKYVKDSSKVSVTKFKGLINQSNTCYLNCFLQSLFMIPEIKNRVIEWNVQQDELCILSQLQKLFIKLEVSEDNAVSTKEFTNSFKWFVEHMEDHQDVHEFLAALLEGIQEASKKYSLDDIVTEFYLGTLLERILCTGCNVTKYKDVSFLHIQLPVKDIKGCVYDSIEDIIRDYTTTELLTDSDRLFCDSCNKKCDTEKGHVFKVLPYLLNLSLSRFDYDCAKMRVVKINGRITFPLELTIKDVDGKPFTYELISVIVHKGSPSCGHYYANIKDVSDNTWYLFDDRNVYSIDIEELEKAYGVGVTTGYVFIYRMIDKVKNEMPIKKEDFSPELKKLALNLTTSRDTIYIFKVHLKRGGRKSVLKKFVSFGFNTLSDLKRRIISHLNIMMPEIDTDETVMSLYDYELEKIERDFEEKEFCMFLSDFLESNGDVIHILFEANKERPVEDDEITCTPYRYKEQTSDSLKLVEIPQRFPATKPKNTPKTQENEDFKSLVKSHVFVNADHLRNYKFNGKIIVNCDLLRQSIIVNILSILFEKNQSIKELKRNLDKVSENCSAIELYYPNELSNSDNIPSNAASSVACNGTQK